jgi:predicted acyltransferase
MDAKQRIDAIDVFRGLALAGMLLVNNPGDWSNVYWPLLHASWHGLTPTDIVFPFFLFIVGAAMAYSFQTAILTSTFPWRSICRRTFLLIGIGILLSAIPFHNPISEWRLPGVLQRIGLCYFFVAVLLRHCRPRQLLIVSGVILIVYWLVLSLYGAEPYAKETNLPRTIDMMILGSQHMWRGLGFAFDPEGLFSTLPAAVTCLSGYLVTLRLQTFNSPQQKIKWLILAGVVCTLLGIIWHFSFPINKSLWTSSYVLVTTGIACLTLAFIIACWDVWQVRRGLQALRVYGSNPILLFVLAGVFTRGLMLIEIGQGDKNQSLKEVLYGTLAEVLPAKIASFSFAFLFMLFFYVVAWWLYQRKIFMKL